MRTQSSHKFQPLDVGCFAPLKKACGSLVEQKARLGINSIDKLDSLEAFPQVRERAFQAYTIQNSFAGAGLIPFDPDRVLNQLNIELKAPTPPGSRSTNSAPKIPYNTRQLEKQASTAKKLLKTPYALEEHSLLPRGHLGGRKGISVDHLIQLLMDAIFDGWGRGQKVSMLLLDVAGAFDNVSHTRLLHNLKIARLGHFAGWLESFLSDRQTRLQLPSYLSRIISTPTGIPQGSPISPILFLLFNTPLIRALTINTVESMRIQPPISGRTLAFGWIDDACTIALSGSYAANQRLLEWALDKAAVWSWQHSSRFAPDKFELIHFQNPLDPDPGAERDTPCDYTEPWNGQDLTSANWEDGSAWEVPVEPPGHDQLPIKDHATGHVIRPVEHAKYLGIWLDKTLSFITHCAKAVAKANGSLEALRSISASTWGTSLLNMRTIYLAAVVLQMLYGVAAWYSPTSGRTKYAKRQKTISEFERIQTRAAVLISGAFRNTASAALGAEIFLPPVRLHMQQMIEETAIRIQTVPVMACPRGLESRKAHVLAPWELPLNYVIEGADSAVQEHDRICQESRRQIWYSDGSSFNGHVGGAAVSIRAGKVRKKYLGAAADSTVYVGELEGVKMALKWAEAAPITVFSDSQAAIQAVQNPGRPSGQYVLRAIYERIRTLRDSGLQQEDIELRWIPAHIGIEGNERADEAAKRAAIKGIELSSAGPRELAARPITRPLFRD
ncbi:putative RNA-directed DNA polymerase from transposon X-element [Aspergillus affinis]|uniref:putative RNA-directed DNA polymerase from transposon X-element n=1 Tax=Aspergillus affinis TaxID=1070780 RepID=UPI0022FE0DA8|nr:putative RNA-directed DNA polymerase from transposon X-element [Aspergillus affinis]KAI9035184.1 putative RNA-directed DNA polymerase from transposon X-element [Aspergillus affinis]